MSDESNNVVNEMDSDGQAAPVSAVQSENQGVGNAIPSIEDAPDASAAFPLFKVSNSNKEHVDEMPTFDFVEGGAYVMNDMANDIIAGQKYIGRKTGFPEIDAVQRLKPGMYYFGGGPSVGKTTFLWQLADNLAISGIPVIYISLEIPKGMMYQKSITRFVNLHADVDPNYTRFTNNDLDDGKVLNTKEYTEQCIAYNNAVGNKLFFFKPDRRINIEQFFMIYDWWKDNYAHLFPDNPPIVILDYLQILAPSFVGSHPLIDKKQNIDHAISELVSFQTRENATIIAVCSFNRSSYKNGVTMEAFKETGDIEYSADVMWGLQYAVLTNPKYLDKKASEADKQKMVTDATTKKTRDVQLVAIKNRFGSMSYTVNLDYEPRYDTFRSSSGMKQATNVANSASAAPVQGGDMLDDGIEEALV